jgi:hypothetical protein
MTYFNPLKHNGYSITLCTAFLMTKKPFILFKQCVFCTILTMNSNYFPEQHSIVSICNRDTVFSVRQELDFYILLR